MNLTNEEQPMQCILMSNVTLKEKVGIRLVLVVKVVVYASESNLLDLCRKSLLENTSRPASALLGPNT